MRLLVLGGTTYVGRAVVTQVVADGWHVTTFNRGRASWSHPGVTRLLGDRRSAADLEQLRSGAWDLVVDTWAAEPSVVLTTAEALADAAGRYAYVSSRAVYAAPVPRGLDESAPTVDASAEDGPRPEQDYGRDKRGGELAAERVFGDRALLARAGLVLGPWDDPARLPAWLDRAAAGGELVGPGDPEQPWRFVDARDLAGWLLAAGAAGVSGPVNLTNPEGHATTRSVLEAVIEATGGRASLRFVPWPELAAAGVDRWEAFPGWVPAGDGNDGLVWTDTARAEATGLACRPAEDTVADTWAWLSRERDAT